MKRIFYDTSKKAVAQLPAGPSGSVAGGGVVVAAVVGIGHIHNFLEDGLDAICFVKFWNFDTKNVQMCEIDTISIIF